MEKWYDKCKHLPLDEEAVDDLQQRINEERLKLKEKHIHEGLDEFEKAFFKRSRLPMIVNIWRAYYWHLFVETYKNRTFVECKQIAWRALRGAEDISSESETFPFNYLRSSKKPRKIKSRKPKPQPNRQQEKKKEDGLLDSSFMGITTLMGKHK